MATRTIRNAIIGVLLVMAFLVVAVGVSAWRGRSSLAQWKKRMQARGEKLQLQEFRPAKSSTAAERQPLLTACSQFAKSSFYVGSLETMKGVAPGWAAVLWKSPVIPLEKSDIPWTTLQQEVERNAETLAAVRGALRNPTLDLGWDYIDPLLSPNNPLVMKRSAAYWLRAATIEELHETKLSAAADSIRALLALARVDEVEGNLVNLMVRVAICQLGLEMIWESLQAEGWNDGDLALMAEALKQVRLMEHLARTAEVERAISINIFERMRQGTLDRKVAVSLAPGTGLNTAFDQYAFEPVWQLAWSNQDELYFLECMQPLIEGFRQGGTNYSWQSMRTVMNPGLVRLQRLANNRFDRMRFQITQSMMVSWGKATTNLVRVEALKNLAETALAIKRSQVATGKVPQQLNELIPHYLAELPRDPMDGQPLRYRVETNGEWTLYSIGTDLHDDGGDATPSDPKADSFRAVRGRDIVWPKADPAPLRQGAFFRAAAR